MFFAVDAPLTAGKDPKHEIRVMRVDDRGAGPILKISAATGDATHAAIARGEGDTLALTFSAQDGVYFAKIRCAAE